MVSPEETLQRIRPLFPSFGITRLAVITGLDRIGIPVVAAIRPNARSLSVSQGKGLTTSAAMVSAAMEAIELFHAEHVHLPLIYGCARELANFRKADIASLQKIQNSRYNEELSLLWIEAQDIVGGHACLLPFEIVHVSAKIPSPSGSGCFAATSNGLASGNDLNEATLHGLCEVIERDSTTIWEASEDNRIVTHVALDTISDNSILEVLEKLTDARISVDVWCTTTDIGIASFICEIVEKDSPFGVTAMAFTGMGCHPSRCVALSRALTEAIQCRLTYISGARDDLFRHEYHNSLAARYHTLAGLPATVIFDDVPHYSGETILEDLEWVVSRVERAGYHQIYVVDISKREFGIAVVRVVVPGLAGPDDDDGYVPGKRALNARSHVWARR